jgi:hypothetical protein
MCDRHRRAWPSDVRSTPFLHPVRRVALTEMSEYIINEHLKHVINGNVFQNGNWRFTCQIWRLLPSFVLERQVLIMNSSETGFLYQFKSRRFNETRYKARHVIQGRSQRRVDVREAVKARSSDRPRQLTPDAARCDAPANKPPISISDSV